MGETIWDKYLKQQPVCSCGRIHKCDIRDILIEEDAVKKLPELINKYGYKKICIVCDLNTLEAAGESVYSVLKSAGISYEKVLFEERELVPDEDAIVHLLTGVPNDCDLLMGVGSGTINDLCRYISYKMKIDYFIVATAPSMDGYASSGSPLIVKHLKTTFDVCAPKGIIGDLNILVQAPVEMIAAGIGDIIGKCVCLTDWKIANLINGEYICDEVVKMVECSMMKVLQCAEDAIAGKKSAIQTVMEGLVLTGIAMSFVGNSRPASGSEHHLSHYWEMMFLLEGRKDPLHGAKVGIGTVASIRLYEMLKEAFQERREMQKEPFDYEAWKIEIQNVYGLAAESVLDLERETNKNGDEKVKNHCQMLEERRNDILSIIEALPDADEVMKMLKGIHAPYYPKQIGVSKEIFYNSIVYAKEVRNRFGLLQILYDFGVAREFASRLAIELYDE
ncbi:sn-glycerol-1-phosphate dehydrogenase [Blautia sp.]|uniref:sn-glycerol-1-phosphate dehydrogenase n=1 Tax=Blautia sp. TaxID=1955243 RepID=UPI002E77183D|nr:sn-glycerol-1-phosphate dehydrogenase [Blautia sp.]MEE0810607.1 sn-glycerol-1-phosphate dehydrogenase [Blautia sp.]